jgi:hypothetical protein
MKLFAEREGFEPSGRLHAHMISSSPDTSRSGSEGADLSANRGVYRTVGDGTTPDPAPSGGVGAGSVDVIEAGLVGALAAAANAGRFDVVAQLAKELEARRLARLGNVVHREC